MKLSIDHWEGVTYKDEEIEMAHLEDVERFIQRLDQDTYTNVSLEGPGKSVMTVGGGNGDYVVIATFDQERWFTLRMGPRGGPQRLVTVGGQPGDYDSDIVVTFDDALAAARYWFHHTALDPALTWRPD
jgi:hypothetical protein